MTNSERRRYMKHYRKKNRARMNLLMKTWRRENGVTKSEKRGRPKDSKTLRRVILGVEVYV